MKKIFELLALVAMVATSCQQTPYLDEVGVVGGNLTTVSFNLGTPQIANRANYSTGETATHLQYAVYNADGQILNDLTVTNAEIHGSTHVEFQLTTGNTYFVLFWASAYAADDDDAPYQVNLANKTLTVSYDGAVSNDEKRDAFYYYDDFTVVSGMDPINADLKRPFAQLNIGTSDFAKSASAGHTVSYAKVETLAYTGLDFSTGAVTGEKVAATFGYAAVPGNAYEFPIEDDIYDYVAMNYLLMGTTKEPIDVKFSYATGSDGENAKTRTVGSAPFARNHRTNLYGQLFTSSAKVNVNIEEEYDDPSYDNEHLYYIDNEGTYHIVSAAGLQWFAEQVNSGNLSNATVVLENDIDLSTTSRATTNWTPIGQPGKAFSGTFDGAGHTVSNLNVEQEGYAGLFGYAIATIKNLNVENVVIVANHYAGAVVGQGYSTIENCHVKNVNITLSTLNNDWGDKAGAIIGQSCEGPHGVINCSAEDVTIKGYRDLGGIAGMAHNDNFVKDCAVKNVSIVQDLSDDYKKNIENEATPNTLNAIVGRKGSNVTLENNTVDGEVLVATETKTSEELNNALTSTDDATVLLPEGQYNIAASVGNGNAGDVTIVGNGVDNTTIVTPTTPTNNSLPDVYANNKDVVFKNLTFVNTYSGYESGIGGAKSVTFINCKILGEMYCQSHAPHTFINCTFDPYNGYLYTWNSDCVFEGCTFEASEGKALQVYGDGARTNHVDIKNCKFTAAKVAYTYPGNPEQGGKPVTAIDINTANGAKMVVNVENCTTTGFGVGENSGSDLWNIKSGALSTKAATLTVDGELKSLIDFGLITEGYYCIGSTYTVLSGEGFLNVATQVLNDSTKNVTVELANDIDLAGTAWPAVKTNAAFVLDGKGYAVKNLTTSAVEDHGFYSTAMFTSTRKATTIKNLVVENATVTGNGLDNSHGAVLVACNYSDLTISRVTVKGSTVNNCDRSAMLVTYLYFTDVKVESCVIEGCTVNSIGTAGAILGVNNSHNFEMVNCEVNNTTVSSSEGSNKAGIFIGTWQDAGTLTESGNTHSNSKAINASEETNNVIGRHA